jgi:hypothetical protein
MKELALVARVAYYYYLLLKVFFLIAREVSPVPALLLTFYCHLILEHSFPYLDHKSLECLPHALVRAFP